MNTWILISVVVFGALLLWAIFQRARANQAARDIADVRAEATREIAKAREAFEQDSARLRTEAAARLKEVDAELQNERARLNSEAKRIEAHFEGEHARALAALAPLRRFEGIANAEAEALRLMSDAVRTAQELKTRANDFESRVQAEMEVRAREAETRLRSLRAQADTVLGAATGDARRIVDEAHSRAEKIAGSAYTALREKDALEKAVTAIHNVIDGYGDRYVVPTRSVLDGLASDYGHLEAGEQLKKAREHSRRMVEEGHAADCDYAEATRKETAVRFVIDAFNGRVDAILSRSRNDNLGTLQQEIHDAFSLVNLNGEAFRNARIREEYLEGRLSELKWAIAAQELRFREREEQRRIQEQIRDEEKAQREIERALKDAEKEEGALKRALEIARAEVDAASKEQQGALQARIDALNVKLAEAEAKNKRALSLAQQTRAGNVYITSNLGSFGDDVVKIGMTRRLDPFDRIRELGDASVPFGFDVHAMIETGDAPTLERELHDWLDERRVNRVNYRKEFFRIPLEELREFLVKKGLKASFTITAEAREYRESLAMQKMTPEQLATIRKNLVAAASDGEDESGPTAAVAKHARDAAELPAGNQKT